MFSGRSLWIFVHTTQGHSWTPSHRRMEMSDNLFRCISSLFTVSLFFSCSPFSCTRFFSFQQMGTRAQVVHAVSNLCCWLQDTFIPIVQCMGLDKALCYPDIFTDFFFLHSWCIILYFELSFLNIFRYFPEFLLMELNSFALPLVYLLGVWFYLKHKCYLPLHSLTGISSWVLHRLI